MESLVRFYLPRYRRRRPLSDADLPDAKDQTDPPDYVPSEEDFAPSPPKPPRPMNRFPKRAAMFPALFCFALFWVASFHEWRGLPPSLTASGETVFAKGEYWRLLDPWRDMRLVGQLCFGRFRR